MIEHVPGDEFLLTLIPEIVQPLLELAMLRVPPSDPPEVLTVIAVPAGPEREVFEIVSVGCAAFVIVRYLTTLDAPEYVTSPAWEAVIEHVPVATAVRDSPLIEHAADVVLKVTG